MQYSNLNSIHKTTQKYGKNNASATAKISFNNYKKYRINQKSTLHQGRKLETDDIENDIGEWIGY